MSMLDVCIHCGGIRCAQGYGEIVHTEACPASEVARLREERAQAQAIADQWRARAEMLLVVAERATGLVEAIGKSAHIGIALSRLVSALRAMKEAKP